MENLNQQKDEQSRTDIKNPEENRIDHDSPEASNSNSINSSDKDIEIGALGIMQHSSKEILTPGEVGKMPDLESEEEE